MFCPITIGRIDTALGLITKTPPTSTPRALRSPSALSSSSTQRRPSASFSHTRPPLAVTPPKSSVSSTPSRLATSTASPPQSTGSLVTMLLSTPASRTRRPRLCSPSSALSSLTSDSPLCQRSRLLQPSKLGSQDRKVDEDMRVPMIMGQILQL
jgi:hypothetical protein